MMVKISNKPFNTSTMISKKTQLCIDVLISVGSTPPGALVTTHALAQRLGISISHIETIMVALKAAGFVHSVRGPGGGYSMARHPDHISVWEVVHAVGTPEETQAPPTSDARLTHALEESLHKAVKQHLSAQSIGEFVQTDPAWDTRPAPSRLSLGIGPKPTGWFPVAPNSVFQLSSFLQGAMA